MAPFNPLLPRNLLRLFVAMATLALVLRLIGPNLVSADRMEREIEAKIAAWTGAKLSISGTPEFAFWPNPQFRFDHARLRNPVIAGGDGSDLLTVERISVGFSPISSLFGTPKLGAIELVRPTLLFHRDESGALNWHGGNGITRKVGERGTVTPPDFGTIVVRDGTIVVDDRKRREHYAIASIEGKIDWPTIFSGLDISLQGIVKGQAASWKLTADDPTKLLDGQDTAVRTSLASDLLKLDFEGAANLSRDAFATGRIKLETPSFGHLLTWQEANFVPARGMANVTLEGTVTTSGHTARLDDISLSVQGSNATGALDVSLPPQSPSRIGGTLAFDRIGLLSLLNSYTQAAFGHDDATPLPTGTVDGIELDLRISSREAAFEPLMLTDVAAGIRVLDGEASLDIAEGTLMGGRVSGRITGRGEGLKHGGELRLSLRDVDLGELVGLSGLAGPLPTGRGSADIDLFTEQRLQEPEKADLTGSFSLNFDQGALTNFDGPVFERMAQGKTFFDMKEAAGGSFEFTKATIEGHLDGGIAELTKATFDGSRKTLAVSGTVPFRNGSVALAGSIVDRDLSDDAIVKPAINFLVGGSWPWPVISPVALLLEGPAN